MKLIFILLVAPVQIFGFAPLNKSAPPGLLKRGGLQRLDAVQPQRDAPLLSSEQFQDHLKSITSIDDLQRSSTAPEPAALPLSPSVVGGALMPLLLAAPAMAKGREFGIWEGKIISSLHPIAMFSLAAATIYSAVTGWNWRRIRTIQGDINELKAQLPTVGGKAPSLPLSKTIASLSAEIDKHKEQGEMQENVSAMEADLQRLRAAVPLGDKIEALSATRKELVKGDFRDKHWTVGSVLLGLGVTFAIEGPVNTYLRTGKLFPGPHLYCGAAITVMWALAAALVPAMQKGNDTARIAHISLNATGAALFLWQINTGLGIWQKTLEFTQFP